ncbi:HlyD family type I secretion periplasmic adaptor subunit [Magnetospira sp. QH-2]|uniref:HlyD family type I secretion periplasmic adaptor subunit n=1 Tax=Magnetospira sp. (strain QH-2) TaxID=1288970 RepID=UPI0003E81B02|nr:HlyD family type I secretion periplasmic adaptor subunit [Magnetospira sp. QH-2]CCQ75147.1 protein of unknown function[Include cyclic nucleotide-binding domain and HlyD family secretion protein domain] [Magnetospira sp. QH-2]
MSIRSFPRGEFIFREGETGGYAYILQSGEVEIVKSTAKGPMVLGTVDKGTLFGEMAIIDESPRSASARAKTDVEALEVNRDAFLQHISRKPDAALSLMTRLATYVRSTNLNTIHAGDGLHAVDDQDQTEHEPNRALTDIIDDTDAIYDAKPSRPTLLTGILVLVFVLVAVVFLSVTFVDTTVSARGKFGTTVPNVIVQATTGSVIEDLLIRRGQVIKKGDVVAKLDGTYIRANLKVEEDQLAAINKRILRISTEQYLINSGEEIPRGLDLDEVSLDILSKRLDEYRSRQASFDADVSKLKQEISSAKSAVVIAKEQLSVKQRIEDARKALFDKKIGSLLNYLTAQDDRLAAKKEFAETINTVKNLSSELVSAEAERQAFVAEWSADLAEQLAKEEEANSEIHEEVVKLQRQTQDLTMRSPVDGVVLDLPSVTVGSIVKEGEPMLTLVRTNVPLALEVDVDPKDVSDLRIGADVSVKLDALPFQQFGDLPGKLIFVSNDTFPESLDGEKGAWYRGRVEISPEDIRALPKGFHLTPGMLATADLKVGQRRLVTYFTNPIVKNFQQSFQEPD